MPPTAKPDLSVVMATCRRPALLRRCLDALLAQTLEPSRYEIIVVDDGRSDETEKLVGELAARTCGTPALRCLRTVSTRGPAAARNLGWRASEAAIIAFTDDDTVPDRDWLRAGLAAIGAGSDAVTGRVVVPLPERPTDHGRMTGGLASAEFVTANVFVRRDALLKVGGFDERFTRPWREDSDLQFSLIEAGAAIGHAPDAIVVHPVRPAPWGISLSQQHNVFFDALLYRKHPRLFVERIRRRPPWLYLAIVVAAVGAFAAAVAGRPRLASLLAGVAGAGILVFAFRRLDGTSLAPAHVLEMLLTSAFIPFLALYWRVLGAWRFRVLFP